MKQVYTNILVMLIGLLVISWAFDISVLLYITIGLAILSMIPVLARQINRAWMKLAQILGWINSRILLTIVYAFILVPLAMISRLFKKDPLHIKWNDERSTYYETRDHTFKKSDMDNPW
ncbi:SxtJ family membrane protein [Ekhidna sp.]|uniref:SxtJ family membrane protein n=1 Tax=Ekhidna sp. TaxID=2608089 RepID=UPI003BAB52EE